MNKQYKLYKEYLKYLNKYWKQFVDNEVKEDEKLKKLEKKC